MIRDEELRYGVAVAEMQRKERIDSVMVRLKNYLASAQISVSEDELDLIEDFLESVESCRFEGCY